MNCTRWSQLRISKILRKIRSGNRRIKDTVEHLSFLQSYLTASVFTKFLKYIKRIKWNYHPLTLSKRYHKYVLLLNLEVAGRRCSIKKVFLNILQNSQANKRLCWSFFFNKVLRLRLLLWIQRYLVWNDEICTQSARDLKWTSFVSSKLVRSSQSKRTSFRRLLDVLKIIFIFHLNVFQLRFKFTRKIVICLLWEKHFNFMIWNFMTLSEGM